MDYRRPKCSARPSPPSKWKNLYTFGCPAYILVQPLQSGNLVPHFHHCTRVGIYIGHSPQHAGNIALIMNPHTRCTWYSTTISPWSMTSKRASRHQHGSNLLSCGLLMATTSIDSIPIGVTAPNNAGSKAHGTAEPNDPCWYSKR
jgi:hypothetical protein